MAEDKIQSAASQLATRQKPRRRWLQFTIRGLIVVMIIAAIGVAWLRSEAVRARQERFAVEKAIEQRVTVQSADAGPAWLTTLASEDIMLKYVRLETQNWGLTDEDTVWLGPLNDLQVLNFKDAPDRLPRPRLGDATVAHVADMHDLRELSLSRFDLTDDGAAALRNHPEMLRLELQETLITDAGLVHIRDMHKLQHLNLSGLPGVTDEGLIRLNGMQALLSLNLNGTRVTGTGFQYLAPLQSLGNLQLQETPLTNTGLQHISQLRLLEELHLSSDEITDAGIAHLAKMRNLRRLHISGSQLTDKALTHLAGSSSLEELYFHIDESIGEQLAQLANISNLHRLDLSGARLTDDGWEALRELKQVTHVTLTDAQVTDENIKTLVQAMPQLEEIMLDGTPITDAAATELAKLQHVTRINISGTQMTRTGLKAISQYPQLEWISISQKQMGFVLPPLTSKKAVLQILDPIGFRPGDILPPELR